MEFNEATYDFFDNYLSGNLSDGDEGAFENALSEDVTVREEFSFYSSAINAIQMSGSEIFKKQIAEIGTAIPSSAFEKYSPSIKPKNFFHKYWWAITVVSGIIAATLFFVLRENKNPDTDEKENSVLPAFIDSAKTDTTQQPGGFGAPQDSCSYPATDLNSSQEKSGKKLPVKPKGFPDGNCHVFQVKITAQPMFLLFQGNEERKKQELSLLSNAWSGSSQKINVEFCSQNTKIPFYSYFDHPVICGLYVDSTNLKFYYPARVSTGHNYINQTGDTIIMSDSRQQNFILVRGAQNRKLVPENKKPLPYKNNPGTFYELKNDTAVPVKINHK